MFGTATRQNACQPVAPSVIAASSSSALRLHERDEFARDERKRDERSREHDAGEGDDDFEVLLDEPGLQRGKPRVLGVDELAVPALQAENQHVDQAGDDGRNGEGQIDERDEQALSAEVEFRDAPSRGDAENEIRGHRDRGGGEREFHR